MTRTTTKGSKPAAKKPKRLSLSKQTLKDLSPGASGPKGGMGIKIVKTFGSGCPNTTCRACGSF